jgi:hypothetical protein
MVTHWIIRVKDGKNFRNSTSPRWGMKRGNKPIVQQMNAGDILWFLTSKPYGGTFIGMAEFVRTSDVTEEEPLIPLHTTEEMGWDGNEDNEWPIHIHYKNLFDTEKLNLKCIIPGPFAVSKCEFRMSQNQIDKLKKHFENYSIYGTPRYANYHC